MGKLFDSHSLTYYHRNQAKIDAYLSEWIEFGNRMRAEQERNPDPLMLKLRRLRAEQVIAEKREKYEAS